MTEQSTQIALFKGREIRKRIHDNEWWFSVEDVVLALTDSKDPKQYINKLRRRDPQLSEGWVQFVHTLPLETAGGSQKVNCANTEGIFRIIQSIPSPKAEPFKRWLAKVGYERIQEIEDPELAAKRTRAIYKAKGYPDEWKDRHVGCDREYAILTAEISKAAFGLTPSEYKELKGLSRENLRDHMNDLELIFSMLGEAATTEITRNQDAQGFDENKQAAVEGGSVAGTARRQLESKTGKKVVSKNNYLPQSPKKKRLR